MNAIRELMDKIKDDEMAEMPLERDRFAKAFRRIPIGNDWKPLLAVDTKAVAEMETGERETN